MDTLIGRHVEMTRGLLIGATGRVDRRVRQTDVEAYEIILDAPLAGRHIVTTPKNFRMIARENDKHAAEVA